MISIVICSRNPDISAILKENIQNTIGLEFELIVIDNSANKYSIFSAYNIGYCQSKFPFLCFVHEDVLFHTQDWGKLLLMHFKDAKTGLIGVAGGKIMTKVPAQWSNEGRYINVLQYQRKKKTSVLLKEPQDFADMRHSAILLDGVFLSARRELFEKIRFDESFSGFHGYDYDISVQSVVKGYKNYIVYDILLEHFSEGRKSIEYYGNLVAVYKKWEKHLPLFSEDLPTDTCTQIQKIDVKRLERLINRMVKTGHKTSDIINQVTYYSAFIESKKAQKLLTFIRYRIFLLRIIKSPGYLFK
jgi:hypothetical protein